MAGRESLVVHLLLLAILLLTPTQWHCSSFTVQAIEPGHFKFKPAQPNLKAGTRFSFPAWIGNKKIHKQPSTPNPVGNHRPPTRP